VRQHGPWQVLKTHWVHQDPWVRVQHDEVIRPDGRPGTFTVVHIKPGVCVLPLAEDGTAYLTEEFHYAVGQVTIECVSGGRDEGESLEEAARREMREELGIEADDWTDLGRVDPFTACLLSPTQLFLARKLRFVRDEPEGTELIRRVAMPLEQVVRRVMASEITHAPSMTLILKAARLAPNPF
jgi:ADP-ribose pyrophosphatase